MTRSTDRDIAQTYRASVLGAARLARIAGPMTSDDQGTPGERVRKRKLAAAAAEAARKAARAEEAAEAERKKMKHVGSAATVSTALVVASPSSPSGRKGRPPLFSSPSTTKGPPVAAGLVLAPFPHSASGALLMPSLTANEMLGASDGESTHGGHVSTAQAFRVIQVICERENEWKRWVRDCSDNGAIQAWTSGTKAWYSPPPATLIFLAHSPFASGSSSRGRDTAYPDVPISGGVLRVGTKPAMDRTMEGKSHPRFLWFVEHPASGKVSSRHPESTTLTPCTTLPPLLRAAVSEPIFLRWCSQTIKSDVKGDGVPGLGRFLYGDDFERVPRVRSAMPSHSSSPDALSPMNWCQLCMPVEGLLMLPLGVRSDACACPLVCAPTCSSRLSRDQERLNRFFSCAHCMQIGGNSKHSSLCQIYPGLECKILRLHPEYKRMQLAGVLVSRAVQSALQQHSRATSLLALPAPATGDSDVGADGGGAARAGGKNTEGKRRAERSVEKQSGSDDDQPPPTMRRRKVTPSRPPPKAPPPTPLDWQSEYEDEFKRAIMRCFALPDLYTWQRPIIEAVLVHKNDAVVHQPTSGGKSICFQLPVLIDALRVTAHKMMAATPQGPSSGSTSGSAAAPLRSSPRIVASARPIEAMPCVLCHKTAVIISPLVALMKDQARHCHSNRAINPPAILWMALPPALLSPPLLHAAAARALKVCGSLCGGAGCQLEHACQAGHGVRGDQPWRACER